MVEKMERTACARLRKAWEVRVRGYDDPATYFAPSASKARMQAWRDLDAPGHRIVDITARRAPHLDVVLPPRDSLADRLTDEQRHCLLHAFGGNGDPMKAGIRDYFYTRRDDPHLVALAQHGLMKPMDGDQWGEGMTYFVLTDDGKRVALSMVPEYRHD